MEVVNLSDKLQRRQSKAISVNPLTEKFTNRIAQSEIKFWSTSNRVGDSSILSSVMNQKSSWKQVGSRIASTQNTHLTAIKDSELYPLAHHYNSVPTANAGKLYEQSPPIFGAKINDLQKNPNGLFE